MSYASKAGRARVSAKNPQAFGVCDRCGLWDNLVRLDWQYEWRGTSLQNIWLRVCKHCLDVPQEQLRAIQIPADPTPVWQPRVENFDADEIPYYIDPIGVPTGLDYNAVMPYNGAIQKAFGIQLPILSVFCNNGIVYVTCSAPHNLVNNDQIAVEGLSDVNACGFFSITMFTPISFTYTPANPVTPGSLLTDTTRIITCLVGLPRGEEQIPQLVTEPTPYPPPVEVELLTDSGLAIMTDSGISILVQQASPPEPDYLLTELGQILTTDLDIPIQVS